MCTGDDLRRRPDPTTEPEPTDLPCDGAGTVVAWLDVDGDGTTGTRHEACEAPPGSTPTNGGDCDDADRGAHPGAWDAPGDGIDRDCSGADAQQVSCGVDAPYPGSLVVDSDDDLDAFCFDHNRVGGALLVTGPVEDISALACVCVVEGDLRVQGTTAIESLAVLAALTTVNGSVRITDNLALRRASFGARVAGDLEIGDNPALEFGPSVGTFSGSVDIHDNPALLLVPSVTGATIDGLRFVRNDLVYLLDGLYTVTQIDGDLIVTDNAGLHEIDAFPALQLVTGDLVIERNPGLWELELVDPDLLTGVIAPFTLGGELSLRDNEILPFFSVEVDLALSDIRIERNAGLDWVALHALEEVWGDLRVTDNPRLVAVLDPAGHALEVDGDVEVSRNGSEPVSSPVLGVASRLTTVRGDLRLADTRGAADGTYAFDLLTDVGGDLTFEGPVVTGNAFPALTAIGGDLVHRGQLASPHARSLPALVTVGGDVSITDNPTLPSIDLPALTDIGGDLVVSDAPILTTLSAPELANVGGKLDLVDLPAVGAIDLPGLTSVTEGLLLEDCDALATLVDLQGLGSVGGSLRLVGNDALTALDGAASLTDVGTLWIQGNPVLTDLTGLYGLQSAAQVTIVDNVLLGDTAAYALVGAIETVGGPVTVSGNGP